MRSTRGMLIAVCAICGGAASFTGCSRQQEQAAAPAQANAEAVAVAAESLSTSQPPAESGLSIKRGVATLARDRATFRLCDEKAEWWLVDQTEEGLTQTFAAELRQDAAMFYMEAYGERAPVSQDDDPAARAYGGTFVLEQVLYAGVPGEVRGCDTPAADYIVAARGNEPFWAAEVSESQIVWRQPEAPKEIVLSAPETQDAEGAVRYAAASEGHQIEMMIDARPCRDTMSGEFFAYSARAVLDGRQFNGCARVGR